MDTLKCVVALLIHTAVGCATEKIRHTPEDDIPLQYTKSIFHVAVSEIAVLSGSHFETVRSSTQNQLTLAISSFGHALLPT
jgi:hypothetical protein